MNNPTDDLAVRRLLAEYSDACWRKDSEAYGETWAEDGQWCVLGQKVTGRSEIVTFWEQFMTNFKSAWQVQHTLILDLAQSSGHGRIYVNEFVVMPDGSAVTTMGIYHDDYIKSDGRWLFKRRHFDLTHQVPIAAPGSAYETVLFGKPPHDPDPSRQATPSITEVLS